MLSSVNIVSEEKVICLRRKTSIFKESQQVIVLTMDVTADLDWSFQFKKDWLIDEDVSGFNAQSTNFLLCELYLLSWSASKIKVRVFLKYVPSDAYARAIESLLTLSLLGAYQ